MKALLLFSGGLDSMLVAKMLKDQGIEVVGLVFSSYFFDDERAKYSAREMGIELISKDFAKEHLNVVKRPKFGYGNAVNPCIDCHALMFEVANKIFKAEKFDILASGEVLGQRPFSQNMQSLKKIEKKTDLKDRILRPISAKFLPETIYEANGLVDREKLGDISGKSRKRQMELVEKFEIKEFPSPGGGCRLTEKEFGEKVRQILPFTDFAIKEDFELLRIGRHFWFVEENGGVMQHLILGRNKEENKVMFVLASKEDTIIEIEDGRGPTALIRTYNKTQQDQKYRDSVILKAKKKIWQFAKREDEFDESAFSLVILK